MLHKKMVTTKQKLYGILASTFVLGAGCDPDDLGESDEPEEAGEVEFRPIGGVWLNTSSIGPLLFSQIDLDGQALDGLTLEDVFLPQPNDQWLRLDWVKMAGWQLRGKRNEVEYSGADLLGSRWRLSTAAGDPVEVWISAYQIISSNQARYTFQTRTPNGAVAYVCDPDANGDHSAIAIKNLTVDRETGAMVAREHTLYIACLSGAVGKAYKWGYNPDNGVSEFEAAVRMVRADYCFDGASWTVNGTSMQVQDIWGSGPFLYPGNATEAVWTRTGLACLSQPRWTVYTQAQVSCNGAPIPTCPANVSMATYPQTLFWTKLGTQPIP